MILIPPRRRMEAMTFTDSKKSILPIDDNEKAVHTTRSRSSTAHPKGRADRLGRLGLDGCPQSQD